MFSQLMFTWGRDRIGTIFHDFFLNNIYPMGNTSPKKARAHVDRRTAAEVELKKLNDEN
ncbi:MAG TPA: hypothetical protein PLU50_07370 [Pseudobdellovibrionaceae bacterium]|nr:hypothetical protein [Pseudobdellovibrionaceae bacterium]